VVLLAGVMLVTAATAVAMPRVGPSVSSPQSPSGRPPARLAVIPFPGTPDASPRSQVILSALRPSEVLRVRVVGSRTGLHTGRLSPLPGGAGSAFVPARPFRPGERVAVTASLISPAAGTASGAPGSTRLAFSFGVARPGGEPAPPAPLVGSARASRTAPWQSYRSEPHLHPPLLTMDRTDPAGGDIFLTPTNAGQMGPLIENGRGQLVWFDHTGRLTPFNLQVQSYLGHPVLTWWQGNVVGGHGADGRDMILNSSYHTVAVLHGGYGYSSDLHEFQLIPHGRALIDAYVPVHANLSSVGGPSNGTVLDCVIQELDVRTGRVLWEWHAFGHVPLSASYNWVPSDSTPFDYFHLNSIQQLAGNRLLISARNTWSVYMIDERTGRVVWTLGGKYSSYRMDPGTNFEWQHDARMHRRGILTVFDDAALPEEESESSAKELYVNVRTGVVSLVRRFTHSPPILAGSEGSAQLLDNGDVMVGWGSGGYGFSEYTPSGREILDGRFRLGVNSYRAFRFPWTGQPTTPPSLAAASRSDGSTRLYASWNGATQVASWEVLGGASRRNLGPLGSGAARGFQTPLTLRDSTPFFAVQALDASGHVLGRSYIAPTPSHLAIFGPRAFASAPEQEAGVPVGCFARTDCPVRVTIRAGSSSLGTGSATVHAWRAKIVPVSLTSSAVQELSQSPNYQLSVHVSAQGSSGLNASRQMRLVGYSTSGPGPVRSLTPSSTIRLLGTSEFVSPQGAGGVLAACYGPVPCQVNTTVMAGNTVIASAGPQPLGADELGYLGFNLTPAGQSMLSQTPSNQLPAQVTLTSGPAQARGQVALIRYG
jgi:hypothetical protein